MRGGLPGLLELDHRTGGARLVVTSRAGGVSAAPYDSLNLGDHVGDMADHVAENRRRLAEELGVATHDLLLARQVHGNVVATVARGDEPGDADALVTTDPTVAVAVLVADCVPVGLVDPVSRVAAVVHAGWRGIVAGVVGEALAAMVSCGADRAHVGAAIGPSISPRTYKVGDDVVAAFRAAGLGAFVTPDGTGRHLADLPGAVAHQLRHGGVTTVAAPRAFTDGGASYFSDRAQRPCGRFALAARLSESRAVA